MPPYTNRLKKDKQNTGKSSKKKKQGNKLKSFIGFFKNRQFQQTSGLFLLMLAVFMGLSFTSYLNTWKADDTLFEKSFSEILTSSDLRADNIMGKFGAAISMLFIKEGFGLAAYFFVVFFLAAGLKLIWPGIGISTFKTFQVSLLGLVWFSASFAYLFPEVMNGLLPGWFGLYVKRWLVSLVGHPGTGLILLFILMTFLILSGFFMLFKFKPLKFSWRRKKKEKTDSRKSGPAKTETDGGYNVEEYAVDEDDENGFPGDENKKSKKPVHDETADNENAKTRDTEPQEEKKSPDIDFTVENYPESDTEKKEDSGSKADQAIERKGLDTHFDPRLDLPHFKLPHLDLLEDYGSDALSVQKEELEANKNRIVKTLNHYKIDIQKIKATIGPTVTLYEIVPAPGVRVSKIKNLEDDIALSLSALGIRIIAPIPGKGTIGIEVPNQNPDIVSMKSVLASDKFRNNRYELPFGMGKTIANEVFVADLTKMPHLLMAGATGQGKSVGLNAIIASLLYRKHPAEIKFVLVDPKKVELTLFSKIERHYLAKLPDSEEAIITDTRKVVRTLNSLGIEMDTRYELLKDAQVRNIKEYNNKFLERKLNPLEGHRFLPYLILVIDEFADLIMTAGKEIEIPLTRLAQLARAVGIHLIIATQRPSVNIITGSIKANFPARIAFRVISKVDSRTILDSPGADQLVGRGDMLLSTGSDLIRLQCAFIDTPEIDALTDYIGSQRAYPDAYHLPEYVDEQDEQVTEFDPNERDALFEEAARILVQNQQGSTSLLQRKMKIGYNRAGRIIDQLEAAGIVGPFEGSKAREVLIKTELDLEQFFKNMDEN